MLTFTDNITHFHPFFGNESLLGRKNVYGVRLRNNLTINVYSTGVCSINDKSN
ncbi:hypothetical protein YPPY66_0290 [Yersinia pestis PY-66]|nr:hypothetical protein YPPY66_0290 [Yersinia pestis PY-66]